MKLYIQVGTIIQRNDTPGPDATDIAMDLIRGATFEVLSIQPGQSIKVQVKNSLKSFPQIGSYMSIPEKYLEDTYFSVI